jgi:DNA-binding beta-propeller fold protein YncE
MLWGKTVGTSGATAWDITFARFNGANFSTFWVGAQEITPEGLFFKPDGTKMYVIGAAGDDVNEYNLSTAWQVGTASFVQLFSVVAQENSPQGISFKLDGTKMYIIGALGADVKEYNLSTAWDISTAVFLQSYSSAQETSPTGLFFRDDGLKMYLIGLGADEVNEYTLSTAWDISTAVYIQDFSVTTQETAPRGVFFKPDGTKMYVTGTTSRDVHEYNLSTAWDISTAVFLQFFDVAAQENAPEDLFFSDDGTKMYIIGNDSDVVYQYSLSTAWDISTASFTPATTEYFSVAAQDILPISVFFKPDGTKMYVVGDTGNDVNEYDLGTAWDITTAVFLQLFSVAAQETNPQGIFFKDDGTKMYVIGQAGNDVNEYTLSTAWDISTAVFSQSRSVSVGGLEPDPTGLFFKDDGLKMYVTGFSADRVYQYNLSTAWDVSTAVTKIPLLNVSAQDAEPTGIFFKPDGTKMYILGNTGDDVNEYDLTLPWSVGSAVFLRLFSVAAQELAPTDLFFRDDGLKMYILGDDGNDVNEYTLSTAWNISTASFVRAFSVFTQESAPQGISFKDDGTKMYIIGTSGDDVNEYNLSTAWNISTAVFSQLFSVAAQEIIPRGMFFKPDGTKMYIVGQGGLDINEYSLSTAWDVSTASFVRLLLIISAVTPSGIYISPDGENLFVVDGGNQIVKQFGLPTPWSLLGAIRDPTDSFFVNAQETVPRGLFFKDDGTKMYVVGGSVSVNQYNLSTAWDVQTAVFGQVFSVAQQEFSPTGIFFKPDGTKMYITGSNSDAVWAFDL